MYEGGTFSEDAKSLIESPVVIMFYFAILIVVVILMLMHLRKMGGAENYTGYPTPQTVQSILAGPNLRFQEFTGTNQGSTPINIPTLKQLHPNLPGGKERLTAMRESPVFYDISQTLGEYQYASQFDCPDGGEPMPIRDVYGNFTYTCDRSQNIGAVSTEHATASPATAVQEALLMNQLGY